MEVTHTLLQKLSEPEKTLLFHNLNYVPYNNLGKENKTLKLAEFLLTNKRLPSHTECLEGVYGKGSSGKKILNLKKRLLNKILEVYTTETEMERNPKLDEVDIEWIKAKKKLTEFYLLYNAGQGAKVSLRLLEEAISISKKHEHFIVLVECLRFKKWIIGFRKGIGPFTNLQKEIDTYDCCARSVSRAVDTYYQNIIPEDFSAVNDQDSRLKRLKIALRKIKKENSKTKSSVAEYYIKMLELNYYMSLDDFPNVRKICHQMLSLISSNKAVFRKSRISCTYGNLSRCELLSLNYDLAVKYAIKAQEFYPSGSVNYCISKEQEFYALFYGGKLHGAQISGEELLNTSSEELGEFRHSKYAFFIACVYFKNSDYKKALNILAKYQEISKDKEGWDITTRLLQVMCYIEISETKQASYIIESLRKRVRKYSSRTVFASRHKLINALLYQLEKQGFNFKLVNEKAVSILNKLKEPKKKHSWEFLGPELIPFHEWFENKMKLKTRTSR